MTIAMRGVAVLAAVTVVAAPAAAKRNNPKIDLSYTPTEAVAATVISVSSDLSEAELSLELSDDRNVDSVEELGVRTDNDDREHKLEATSDVLEFVAETLVEQADDWDVQLTMDEAALVLAITIERFEVLETNQAVGATYEAWVELDVALRDGDENELWKGTAEGDATRYGRKYSNDNINEVLSDALVEAFGAVVDDNDFDDAVSEAVSSGMAGVGTEAATEG